MNKEQIVQTVNAMPEDFQLVELFEKLTFIEKIEIARTEVKQGNKIPIRQVREMAKKW